MCLISIGAEETDEGVEDKWDWDKRQQQQQQNTNEKAKHEPSLIYCRQSTDLGEFIERETYIYIQKTY